MKKVKIVMVAAAIILSVGFAFATRPTQLCTILPQYVPWGGTYVPAGIYGVHYGCADFSGYCTYYRPNPFFQPNLYLPCKTGFYIPFY
jgi:hypothetical protein